MMTAPSRDNLPASSRPVDSSQSEPDAGTVLRRTSKRSTAGKAPQYRATQFVGLPGIGRTPSRYKGCEKEGCSVGPSYAYDGMKARFCRKHKEPGMIDVQHRRCEVEGCLKQPHFAVKGQRPARFCSNHKIEGMVNVQNRRCMDEDCSREPIYGHLGQKPRFCSTHKAKGMINVKSKRCEHEPCIRHPIYAYEGERARLCSIHKTEGMVDVQSRKCHASGCMRRSLYGPIGAKPQFCADHKADDHTIVQRRVCELEGCNRYPIYGMPGEHKARRCPAHKTETMVDVQVKRGKRLIPSAPRGTAAAALEAAMRAKALGLIPGQPVTNPTAQTAGLWGHAHAAQTPGSAATAAMPSQMGPGERAADVDAAGIDSSKAAADAVAAAEAVGAAAGAAALRAAEAAGAVSRGTTSVSTTAGGAVTVGAPGARWTGGGVGSGGAPGEGMGPDTWGHTSAIPEVGAGTQALRAGGGTASGGAGSGQQDQICPYVGYRGREGGPSSPPRQGNLVSPQRSAGFVGQHSVVPLPNAIPVMPPMDGGMEASSMAPAPGALTKGFPAAMVQSQTPAGVGRDSSGGDRPAVTAGIPDTIQDSEPGLARLAAAACESQNAAAASAAAAATGATTSRGPAPFPARANLLKGIHGRETKGGTEAPNMPEMAPKAPRVTPSEVDADGTVGPIPPPAIEDVPSSNSGTGPAKKRAVRQVKGAAGGTPKGPKRGKKQ